MTRRIILAVFALLLLTPSAWPKFKEDEQKYLDEQFKAVLDQMQAMGNQIAALNAQITELKQSQAQLQALVVRQQHQIQDLDEMLSSLHISNEEGLSKLKATTTDLKTETDSILAKLGQPAPAPVPIPAPAPPVSQPPLKTQGYITNVDGPNIMIDMGSAQGVQPGSRLAVYKATDPNTRVGVIEVTEVVDSGNARARIVTMNAGMKLEFSDMVRVQ
jgi:TolA-binding protein